ncbi:hypothetical protein DFH27DRAFT_562100 [Peziza echinospora]|nr:hypothetical protein DFH27DRAFT_562100 [Peziza echinospora]
MAGVIYANTYYRAWWKLTLVTMATFVGFPLMTLGYMIDSQQFWQPEDYNGVALWAVNGTRQHNINVIQPKIDYWVHSKPQRNLAGADIDTILLEKNLAFYPPAVRNSKLGHFVSLAPASTTGRDGLMVANTLGFLHKLNCAPLPNGEEPKLINFSDDDWKCKTDCSTDESPDLCHSRLSRGFVHHDHTSQILSCARGNKLTVDNGVSSEMEIAIKINPSYETGVKTPTGKAVFPFTDPARKPYSFRANDKISGDHHYVEVIQCKMGFLPGQAIVDSVIRKFMHFSPFNLPGIARQSYAEGLIASEAQEVRLWSELQNLLNLTSTIPVAMLHEYFLKSNYAKTQNDFNSSLPYWFGIQKPGNPTGEILPAREPLSQDKYEIDNMVRLNSTIFSNAFIGIANSTLIRALPTFLQTQKQTSFIYLTDVRVRRGSLPIILAPLMLLGPICFVVYISLEQWNTPTWTEFLDAWAMFKLGREWKQEMKGEGAVSLRESWQAKVLPGYVGDSVVPGENMKWSGGDGGGTGGEKDKLTGHLKLGGRAPLREGVYYT